MHSQRTLCFVIAILVLTASFTTLIAVRATAPKPAAVNQQQIEKFLKKHESLKLDPLGAAKQVRESGRFLLATADQNFELDLTPNDLRSPNYRAEEVIAGGAVRSVPMGNVHTYKGKVRGLQGAEVRFTIDDDKIEGVIITTEERYYIEPLRNYAAASGKSDYVLYKGSDVIEDALGSCATTLDGKVKAEFERLSSSAGYTPQAAGTVGNRQVDLATEADYEYVAYFGNSAAADTEILSIMNQVDGLFQKEFAVTFRVTYQHTWATSADPYTSTSSDGLLNQFTNYWNANISVPRDLVHMWTDNLMDGGNTVGIAWLGTVCRDPAHAYGISLRVKNGLKYSIAGHEIGHNFGATHPDQETPPAPACDGTVMNSAVGMTFDFCAFSQAQMNGYLGINSGCFTVAAPPFAPNPIDDAREFVKQQYRDFLNREADQAGENFWTDNITLCSDPVRRPAGQTEAQCTLRQRETTSGAFFLSPEFQYTGYYVYRVYQGALNRQPKLSEFLPDAQFVGAGIIVNGQLSGAKINQNKADFAQQFVNCTDVAKYRCAEFKAIYDGLNNQQYVDKLFQTTGANPSASERVALVNGLNANPATETRASVLQKVVDGINVISEGNQQFTTTYGHAFYDSEFNRAFVQLEYFGYLRRDPDDAGYAFWLGKLNQFGGNYINAEMVLAFISSPEYRTRFGRP